MDLVSPRNLIIHEEKPEDLRMHTSMDEPNNETPKNSSKFFDLFLINTLNINLNVKICVKPKVCGKKANFSAIEISLIVENYR